MIRLLTLFAFCLSLFAQDQSRLRVIVTMPDGTEHIARISGAPAAAGMDVLRQWLATQQVCTPIAEVPAERDANGNVTKPGTPPGQSCIPKYSNPAEFIKALVLDTAESLAPQFPSAGLKPDVDDIKARQAALEAKRKAAFAAARAEKP
jgi:hypothetical protein